MVMYGNFAPCPPDRQPLLANVSNAANALFSKVKKNYPSKVYSLFFLILYNIPEHFLSAGKVQKKRLLSDL